MHNFKTKIRHKPISILLLFIFTHTSLFAQTQSAMDEDFLNSLPEDVQDELNLSLIHI